MLVAKGGVVAGVTINTGAVVSNAGIVKANSALSAVIGGVVTNANTIEALGSGAVVKILGSITDTGTVLRERQRRARCPYSWRRDLGRQAANPRGG